MVGYIFCVFDWKYHFWADLVQKINKLKFVTGTNSNVQNSLVMFTFSVFDQKYFVGQIWSKRLKLSF